MSDLAFTLVFLCIMAFVGLSIGYALWQIQNEEE